MTQDHIKTKPQWLQKLEEESWQAELIISGLAIYGTLQMPELIEWLIDWCLANMDQRFFRLLYLFFTYLGIGVYLLIFIFIGHFVLRAVWIGLVGLNSVYPNGINEESDTYARHFIRQFRADHPDQNNRIDQLDKLCSVLFALGAQMVMIFMAINIDIAVLGAAWYLVDSVFGAAYGSTLVVVFFVFFVLYSVFFMISNMKRFRDSPLMQKWQYPVYKRVNSILLHIFFRPASYLGMVFQTNLSIKRYAGMLMALLVFVFIFFGARFFEYRFFSFIRPELLYEHFDRSDRLVPEHYANFRQDGRRLLSLELETDKAEGRYLRVFVPVFSREDDVIDQLCGEPEAVGETEEIRARNRAFYTDCYRKMHRFYVNDSLYQAPDLIKYTHPNQGEEGILVYLATESFKNGQNVLRVEKSEAEPGSTLRQMQAVFWFER